MLLCAGWCSERCEVRVTHIPVVSVPRAHGGGSHACCSFPGEGCGDCAVEGEKFRTTAANLGGSTGSRQRWWFGPVNGRLALLIAAISLHLLDGRYRGFHSAHTLAKGDRHAHDPAVKIFLGSVNRLSAAGAGWSAEEDVPRSGQRSAQHRLQVPRSSPLGDGRHFHDTNTAGDDDSEVTAGRGPLLHCAGRCSTACYEYIRPAGMVSA